MELGVLYPSMAEPGDTNDHGFLFMVVGILDETLKEEQIWVKTVKKKDKRKDMKFGGGGQLRLAGEMVHGLLDEHAL